LIERYEAIGNTRKPVLKRYYLEKDKNNELLIFDLKEERETSEASF